MAAIKKRGEALSQALAQALLAALDGRGRGRAAAAWGGGPETALGLESGADVGGVYSPQPSAVADPLAQVSVEEPGWADLELALGRSAMRVGTAAGRPYGVGADTAAFERAAEEHAFGLGADAAAFGLATEERPYDVGAANVEFWQSEGMTTQSALPPAPLARASLGQRIPQSTLAAARFTGLDARALSRQFERDARRYDGA